jgi:hypothetical protein
VDCQVGLILCLLHDLFLYLQHLAGLQENRLHLLVGQACSQLECLAQMRLQLK